MCDQNCSGHSRGKNIKMSKFTLRPRAALGKIDRFDTEVHLMNLQCFLDENGVRYRHSRHDTAFTASGLAQAEHVPGRKVIKPVVVNADGSFFMCALPASHKIDFEELKRQLEARYVSLVNEEQLAALFPDCEVGAVPPIGRLYGMTTLMDESLIADDRVTFQAGTHEDAITMSLADYRRVARPEVAYFGRHL